MKFLIIGLGIYGRNLALDLTAQDHEVIGADIKPAVVEEIKDHISTAFIVDSTEESALSVLPLKNVDLVVVAIGENFGASIKTVAILKQLGVAHIYARAIDKLHHAILQSFEIDRIVTPEQRAASDLVNELELGTTVETLTVDPGFKIMKFKAPQYLEGTKYADLDLEKDYGLKLIAVTRLTDVRNALGIKRAEHRVIDVEGKDELLVSRNDVFVTAGQVAAYRRLFANS